MEQGENKKHKASSSASLVFISCVLNVFLAIFALPDVEG
jgi:hypothetical protein